MKLCYNFKLILILDNLSISVIIVLLLLYTSNYGTPLQRILSRRELIKTYIVYLKFSTNNIKNFDSLKYYQYSINKYVFTAGTYILIYYVYCSQFTVIMVMVEK